MNAAAPRRFCLASLLASVLLIGACATAPSHDPVAERVAPATRAPGAASAASQSGRPLAPDDSASSPGQRDSEGQPALSDSAEPTREFERGIASWYGPGFQGRRTANGERFDMHSLTAAHKTLPFGTRVRVRSLVTGKEVEVRINDRGPFSRGRVIDLSRAAAEALGLLGVGVKNVLLLVPAATPPGREARPTAKNRPVTPPSAVVHELSMR